MITRRDSFLPPSKARGGTTATADPRNVRHKHFQVHARARLTDFYSTCVLKQDSSSKMPRSVNLEKPTSADFQNMFTVLYKEIDPWYKPGEMKIGSFQEELGYIMRTVLKYPFESTISKSAILTATASNHWPNFLGFLDWLMDLVMISRAMKLTVLDEHESVKAFKTRIELYKESSSPSITEQDMLDKITDDFRTVLTFAPTQILEYGHSLDSEPLNTNTLGNERKALEQQILDRVEKIDKLQTQINTLKSTPSPLIELHAEREKVQSELDAAKGELRDVEMRRSLLTTTLDDAERELAEIKAKKRALETESANVDHRLETQEISVTEAQQIATTRQKLLEETAEYDNKARVEQEDMYADEGTLRQARKQAAAAVDQFRAAARSLNFLPTATSELAARFGVDFERVVLRYGAERMDEVSAVDARQQVWAALGHFRTWLHDELIIKRSDLETFKQALYEAEADVKSMRAVLDDLVAKRAMIDKDLKRVQDEVSMWRKRWQAELDETKNDMEAKRKQAALDLLEAQDRASTMRKEAKKLEAQLNQEAQTAAAEFEAMVQVMGQVPKVIDNAFDAFDADLEAAIAEWEQRVLAAEAAEQQDEDNAMLQQVSEGEQRQIT
ncbi:HEC/Ndc80p family-domain-containing protein [Catenaria anguillulae PL171]|uniref:Kinetochore protein NDC80 n=1 Tax=Catenaria anguillulae PL171 TaxID=765915 RepID=A0A1Y2HCY2_9FUNG|nr:HEC/Ndc80p family-domain-containing protein [Catenaria anguillulae PL171]